MAVHELNIVWLLTLLNFFLISSYTHAAGNPNSCPLSNTVSLKNGEKGVLKCTCENFSSLFWYFGNDTTTVKPLIYIDNSEKHGAGFLSGEYDVTGNGSLVIKNVSLLHRGAYSVVIIEPGSIEPIVKVFTAEVTFESEATDVMKKSNTSREGDVDDEEKNGTESVTKSVANDRRKESFMEIAVCESFQHELSRLKTLSGIAIGVLIPLQLAILISIGVLGKKFTEKSTMI